MNLSAWILICALNTACTPDTAVHSVNIRSCQGLEWQAKAASLPEVLTRGRRVECFEIVGVAANG